MKKNLGTIQFSVMILVFFLCSPVTFSQMDELLFRVERYDLNSGYHNGTGIMGAEPVQVFSAIVEVTGIPWLRLHFADAHLGEKSYLIIRSLYDDRWQKLDAVSIEQWSYHSAYFNGAAVEIQLFAAPQDQNIFFVIDEVIAGEWAGDEIYFTICGPVDERDFSFQPATGRLLSPGCTGWIIPNGKIVSAGHCLTSASGNTVLQFNVPQSLPGGTLQHPGPEDQYAVNVSTNVFVNSGVGNDWGVIEAFPNSITNLTPIQAQAAFWYLAQNLNPDSIRITGYGTASGIRNRAQQTHIGPNAGSSGTTMRYRTDTTGGNSGSPVIDEATGVSVGVHSHGGCTSSGGNNNGTSFFSTAFWNAVDQGIPVELMSFTASVSNKDVTLNWLTATETNNLGFEIERSSGDDFISVGFVPGNGTTTSVTTYTFTDYGVDEGSFSYRLKQVDFDGAFEYSPVINVDILLPQLFALGQNFPNPFNPSTKINFLLAEDSKVSLKIFDVLGREVATLISSEMSAGSHQVEFYTSSSVRGLTSGVYFYKLSAAGKTGTSFNDVKKMILTK